jgi:hypothetical protein
VGHHLQWASISLLLRVNEDGNRCAIRCTVLAAAIFTLFSAISVGLLSYYYEAHPDFFVDIGFSDYSIAGPFVETMLFKTVAHEDMAY